MTNVPPGRCRAIADAGYRGHNAPPDYKFRVFTAGQKRRVTPQIKRDFRRRATIEPAIGHSRLSIAWAAIISLTAPATPSTPLLATVGYNFRLLIP